MRRSEHPCPRCYCIVVGVGCWCKRCHPIVVRQMVKHCAKQGTAKERDDIPPCGRGMPDLVHMTSSPQRSDPTWTTDESLNGWQQMAYRAWEDAR